MGDVRVKVLWAAIAIAPLGCEVFSPTDFPPLDAGKGGGGAGGATTTTSASVKVECYHPVDCPGVDMDCDVRTCVEGACGRVELPLGTPTKNQVAGDCQRAVCDGKGHEVLVVDTGDLPNDGNPCTEDVCTASVPSNPVSGPGKPCDTGGGRVCDGQGACVACVGAVDCPPGMACVGNACK